MTPINPLVYCKPRNYFPPIRKPPIGGSHTLQTNAPYSLFLSWQFPNMEQKMFFICLIPCTSDFWQGYGLFMLEELRHSPNGFLYTRGPGMYKIPAAGDIPAEFNVTMLKNVPNPSAVYSSKVCVLCGHVHE